MLSFNSAAAVLAFACVASASAADFDGKRPFFCSVMEAHECLYGIQCQQGLPQDLDVPQFMRVDFSARSMTVRGRTRAIKMVTRVSGSLVLQGAEGQRGWSLAINEVTGRLSGAIAGQDEAVVVFGACSLEP